MDPTERIYKILLDLVGTVLIGFPIYYLVPRPFVFLIAFVIMHTLNFLFNSHFWAVLKFYGLTEISAASFNQYLGGIVARVKKESSIRAVYMYGSVVRDRFTPRSDLDLRLVRSPGLLNGIRAFWFQLRERSRAFLERFPLDTYLLDDMKSLEKMNKEEIGIDLLSEERTKWV